MIKISTSNAGSAVREVTAKEVRLFRENGWVRLYEYVRPDVVEQMLARAKELLGENGDKHESRPGVDIGLAWWNDYNAPAREGLEPFCSFSQSAAMGRNASLFTERNIPIRHFSDQVGVKLPTSASRKNVPTGVHQDYATGHWDRVGNTTFWIALEDMPPERGVVQFYNGSQKEGPLGYRAGGTNGPDVLLETYPWIEKRYSLSPAIPMRAGDATCHSALVVHRAPANTTDRPRWQYITQYFPADSRWTGAPVPGGYLGGLTERGQIFADPLWPIVYSPGEGDV